MKVLAITQARIGSSRLPNKVTRTIGEDSLLSIHLRRILQAKHISQLLVATTHEEGVEQILDICSKEGVTAYQGSLNDVLERFYMAAKSVHPDLVVRLTSDCPLIDPEIIDRVIDKAVTTGLDYVSNTLDPTFPDGIDVEVFTFKALEKAYNEAGLNSEREHVTPYIWKNSSYKNGTLFQSENMVNTEDLSAIRLTVDTAEDFEVVSFLIQQLGIDKPWMTYVDLLKNSPEIQKINDKFLRNEGYSKSINQDN